MEIEFYLKLVKEAADKSKDTSAKVGAVLIDRYGNTLLSRCNEFPDGVADLPERRARPDKYVYTEHAERNAIYAAARKGYATEGATLVQNWYPCAECARAIVQSGIRTLYCQEPNFEDARWGASFKHTKTILEEAGVVVNYY